MSSEALVAISAVAGVSLIGIMFFIERLVTPIIIDVLVELGMKSSSAGRRPGSIINGITGYAAQLKPIPPKKRGVLWRLRHWRR